MTPVSLKIFKTVSSKLLFEILSKIPDISKRLRQEYCSSAAHFLSRMCFCFIKLSFTVLVTKSCNSIFVNLSLKEVMYLCLTTYYQINFEIQLPYLTISL